MSKYSAAQVAKFHQLRQDFIKMGASPYLATGAAYFEASDNGDWNCNLRLRSDATGMIWDECYECMCHYACSDTEKNITLTLSEKGRTFRLVRCTKECD